LQIERKHVVLFDAHVQIIRERPVMNVREREAAIYLKYSHVGKGVSGTSNMSFAQMKVFLFVLLMFIEM
jgi:hypothetical protein